MKYLDSWKKWESLEVEREYYYPKFTNEFFDLIKDISFPLSDSSYDVHIHEVSYSRWQNSKRYESVSIDVESKDFIDWDEIKDVILTIKGFTSDYNFNVDIEIPSEDDYITADEFLKGYSGEELRKIGIIIW